MTAFAENANLKGHIVDFDTKAVPYGYLPLSWYCRNIMGPKVVETFLFSRLPSFSSQLPSLRAAGWFDADDHPEWYLEMVVSSSLRAHLGSL